MGPWDAHDGQGMASKDGKTEDPTPKRKREARKEGRIPRSRELPVAAGLVALVVAAGGILPSALRATAQMLRLMLRHAGDNPRELTFGVTLSAAWDAAMAWALLVALVIAVSVVATVAQGGVVLASKQSRPAFKHLNPKKGLQQLSPKKAAWELVRAAAKIAVVAVAAVGPLMGLWEDTQGRDLTLYEGIGLVGKAIWTLAFRVAFAAVVVAAVDYGVQLKRHRQELKMTKQEIRDEYKNTEGDPHIRSMRRQRAAELARRRSFNDVATADVVVTNPTHFAVALGYAAGAAAPKVLAKGTERNARKIRRLASRHGVPIVENKPLARALYRQVRVGGYVPEKLFDDVVKVLVTAYYRSGKVAQMSASLAAPHSDGTATGSSSRTEPAPGPSAGTSHAPGLR